MAKEDHSEEDKIKERCSLIGKVFTDHFISKGPFEVRWGNFGILVNLQCLRKSVRTCSLSPLPPKLTSKG